MKKIAYLILCHKNVEQVDGLIHSLGDESVDVYIHVDKKNDLLYRELCLRFQNERGIYILSERIAVSWGGFSQVEAILRLIKTMLNTGIDYSYVSLVSGQDLLIKPYSQFREFLEMNYPMEFIEVEQHVQYEARINTFQINFVWTRNIFVKGVNYFLRYIYDHFHVGIKNFREEEIYKGGQWWTLTHDCLTRLMRYLDANPEYFKKFRYTLCSDEHFFQMLLVKMNVGTQIANNNLRYIVWKDGKDSPKVLTMEDYHRILASSCFIGRKFDMETDPVVINELLSYSHKKE